MALVKNRKKGILGFLLKKVSLNDICQWIDKFIYWKVFQKRIVIWTIILFFSLHFLINLVPLIRDWDIDSPSYFIAARGVRERINIYDEKQFQNLADSIFGKSLIILPYIYTPILAQMIVFLSTTHYQQYFLYFLITNTLLTFLCLYLIYYLLDLKKENAKITVLFLFALLFNNIPLIITINYGQLNILVFFLILTSLVFNKKNKQFMSSFFLVLAVLMKIYPALFIIYYAFKKRFKYIFYSIINFIIILSISGLCFGFYYWTEFFKMSFQSFLYGVKPVFFFDFNTYINNNSLNAFLTQLFIKLNISRDLVIPTLLGLLLLLLVIFWKKIRLFLNVECQNFYTSILIMLCLILSTISWQHHYMIMMFPLAYFFKLIIDKRKYLYFIPLALILYFIQFYPRFSGFPFNQMRFLFTVFSLFLLFYLYISEKIKTSFGKSSHAI